MGMSRMLFDECFSVDEFDVEVIRLLASRFRKRGRRHKDAAVCSSMNSHRGMELHNWSADTSTRFVGVIAFALDRDQAAISVATEDIDASIIRSPNDLDTLVPDLDSNCKGGLESGTWSTELRRG
jgi:hypothetical protein